MKASNKKQSTKKVATIVQPVQRFAQRTKQEIEQRTQTYMKKEYGVLSY